MADAMSVAPEPPPRNPARLSKTTAMVPQNDSLSSELIDLWEHAATLYHEFEWQESAETFLYLSRVIEKDIDSTLCLLNAAMIFARLGDYSTASQVLNETSHIDSILALTLFIMGHVEFQLNHLEKAEECLRVASSVINQPRIGYHRFGFDFTLLATQIEDDIRAFGAISSGINAVVSSLPADGLFEAPSRSQQGSLKARDSLDSGRLPTLSEGSSSPIESPIDSIKSLEYVDGDVQWHASLVNPDVQIRAATPGKTPVVTIIGEDTRALPQRSFSASRRIGSLVRRVSKRQNDIRPPLEPPPRRRPAWIARDAQVKDDSVQELSSFIKDLPRQNRLRPRPAAAEESDTRDLSDFLRAGPEAITTNEPARKPASHNSERSKQSDALTQDWDSVRTHSGPPTPSHLRYRSGLGSMLSLENGVNERPPMSQDSPSYTSQPRDYNTNYFASKAHHLIPDSSSDVHSSDSWPLTDDASEVLRVASLRPSMRRGDSGLSIPTRCSSLRHEAASSIRTVSPMSFTRQQESRLSVRKVSPPSSIRQENRQTTQDMAPPHATVAALRKTASSDMLARITSFDGSKSWTGIPGTPSIRSFADGRGPGPASSIRSSMAPSFLSSTFTSKSSSKHSKKSTFSFLNRLGNLGY